MSAVFVFFFFFLSVSFSGRLPISRLSFVQRRRGGLVLLHWADRVEQFGVNLCVICLNVLNCLTTTVAFSLFVSLCVFFFLYVCLSVSFSLFLSVCLSASLSLCLSVSVCLSVCLSLSLSACLSVCLSMSLSLSVFLSPSLSLSACFCCYNWVGYCLFPIRFMPRKH